MNLSKKYERIISSKQGVLYIKGKPGVGKSAIVKALAEKNGWQFFDIRLSQMDSSEIIGIPHIKKVNGVDTMGYAAPEWAVRANERPTLIFFDELNRAPIDVRNAALQILLDRRIGIFEFNDDVYFASAGNLGEEDGTDVEELDNALNNRLVHVKHDLTFEEWKKNFADEHVNPYIVRFIENNMSYFYRQNSDEEESYATPRSWTFLSNFLGKDTEPKDMINDCREFGSHYVGTSIQAFIHYLDDINNISIKDVIKNYSSVKTQIKKATRDKISQLINELEEYDIQKFKKNELDNVIKFLKDIDEDETFSYLHNQSAAAFENLTGNIEKLFMEFKAFLISMKDTVNGELD